VKIAIVAPDGGVLIYSRLFINAFKMHSASKAAQCEEFESVQSTVHGIKVLKIKFKAMGKETAA
jgi:hypothetical protein